MEDGENNCREDVSPCFGRVPLSSRFIVGDRVSFLDETTLAMEHGGFRAGFNVA